MRRPPTDAVPVDKLLDAVGERTPRRPPWRRRGQRDRRAGALRTAAIAAGGALGGAARYGVEQGLPVRPGGFPWGTFAVNVSGSFVLAVLLVLILNVWPPRQYVRPFAAVGFLGAFTTFSTWMSEVRSLVVDGRPALAVLYLFGSLVAGVAAAGLGLAVGRALASAGSRPRLDP